jgi:N-acetylglucosaminyldiphosphoundecaprenol N-acetyl-beta-D-mannosaminyltransferase
VGDSASRSREATDVLGFPVSLVRDSVVRSTVVDRVQSHPGACFHIVTLNPEYVMAARRDPAFADAIHRANLVTADGIGVALAARLNRNRFQEVERVTGVDLVHYLAAASASSDAPLFLLGADPGVAETAAKELETAHPGAKIVGWWSDGTPDPKDDAAALERIRASGARSLAVAYGARGQVMWIDRNREALATADVRVAVGVGGAFDFIAGRVPRAPRWMRRFGLEWLYRLVKEPWRWRRQLVLPAFAGLVVKDRFGKLFQR